MPKYDLENVQVTGLDFVDDELPKGKITKRFMTFDLPFVLLVEDGFTEAVLKAWTHNQAQQAPTLITSGFEIETRLGIFEYWFLSHHETQLDFTALGKECIGSISKNLFYSSVIVKLNKDACLFPRTDRTLARACIDGINNFITAYKLMTRKDYIPYVSSYSIGLFHILDIYEGGEVEHFGMVRKFEQEDPAYIKYTEVLSKEDTTILRNKLKKAEDPNLIDRLESEVWYKLISEDYRMAVIDSAVLLETWIRKFLEDAYSKKGLSKTKMKLKFLTTDGKPMGIGEILEKLILDATGFDFKTTKEYDDVVKISINRRNRLVHGAQSDITNSEARDCYFATVNAKHRIEQGNNKPIRIISITS